MHSNPSRAQGNAGVRGDGVHQRADLQLHRRTTQGTRKRTLIGRGWRRAAEEKCLGKKKYRKVGTSDLGFSGHGHETQVHVFLDIFRTLVFICCTLGASD